jgi:hypothetical protein
VPKEHRNQPVTLKDLLEPYKSKPFSRSDADSKAEGSDDGDTDMKADSNQAKYNAGIDQVLQSSTGSIPAYVSVFNAIIQGAQNESHWMHPFLEEEDLDLRYLKQVKNTPGGSSGSTDDSKADIPIALMSLKLPAAELLEYRGAPVMIRGCRFGLSSEGRRDLIKPGVDEKARVYQVYLDKYVTEPDALTAAKNDWDQVSKDISKGIDTADVDEPTTLQEQIQKLNIILSKASRKLWSQKAGAADRKALETLYGEMKAALLAASYQAVIENLLQQLKDKADNILRSYRIPISLGCDAGPKASFAFSPQLFPFESWKDYLASGDAKKRNRTALRNTILPPDPTRGTENEKYPEDGFGGSTNPIEFKDGKLLPLRPIIQIGLNTVGFFKVAITRNNVSKIQLTDEELAEFYFVDRDRPFLYPPPTPDNDAERKLLQKKIKKELGMAPALSKEWSVVYRSRSAMPGKLQVLYLWSPRVGGGGGGLGRSDTVDSEDYVWRYCGSRPDIVSTLAKLLNLDPKRKFNEKTYREETVPGKADEKLDDRSVSSRVNAFELNLIRQKKPPACFVAVNVANGAGTGVGAAADKAADPIKAFLDIFAFKYYRRIDEPNLKVIKRAAIEKKKVTLIDKFFPILDEEGDVEVGLHLPIFLNSSKNLLVFKQDKQKASLRPVIKNKGNDLFRPRGPRIGAGSVMKRIVPFLPPLPADKKENLGSSSLSATKFSRRIMADQKVNPYQDWRKVKDIVEIENTPGPWTKQEWCHLRGHGDGGEERVGNFVSGSYHCNTEQLAIESGQRLTTQKKGNYVLKSTAYLFRGATMVSDSKANYLGTDDKYKSEYKKNPEKPGRTKPDSKYDEDVAITKSAAPVAVFVRYKIYKKVDTGLQKVFDYVFEGQSEFFDKNQYRLLSATVQFLIRCAEDGNDAAFQEWLKDKPTKSRKNKPDAAASDPTQRKRQKT